MPANSLVSLLGLLLSAAVCLSAPETKCAGESGDEQGFQSLFDGKTLNGWTGSVKGYVPENGMLVCLKEGGGVLRTEKEYKDFVFRFEFKIEPGGNNGVGIRMPDKGNAAFDAMEIQILDDYSPIYKKMQIQPYQFHGSIYGVVPAKQGHLKPAGQWNSQEISARGSQIKITLNGAVIVDADISKITETVDHRPHPGLHRPSGFIGFLGHGARIEFRNMRIKVL